MSLSVLLLQSIISALITILVIFISIIFFPFITNNISPRSVSTAQELPLYPLTSTFFGLPIPTDESGLDNIYLTLNIHGKVYAIIKKADGISLTVQTPQNRIFSLLITPSTKIVNGDYSNLEQILIPGKNITIEEVYDIKTRLKQMKQLTIQ